MLQYLVRRLALMAPVAFLVSVGIFALIHLTPGDPALLALGESATPETVAAFHRAYGLEQPLPQQYVIWLGHVARGDLGRSIRTRQPVLEAIIERLPATAELGLAALAWALCLGVTMGVLAALRRGSAVDVAITGFTVSGVSVPNFFLGLVLILVLGIYLPIFPIGGYVPLLRSPPDNLIRLVMPAITLGTAGAAVNMRQTRSAMIEVLRQDYIRTARAKGAARWQVVSRHALKNALIPVVTIIGLEFGAIIGGAFVTETVFSWPGVGKLAVDSIFNRDYQIIQGVVLLIAFSYMVANLLVDLAYAWLDPRITYS